MSEQKVVVVGAGIFGVTAALELRNRGYSVTLVDPGPVPNPLAASTDISKVIRMEYGSDHTYMALMEEAREGWLAWNEEWREHGAEPLYHETGVLMLSRSAMEPGGFEHDSYETLRQRGHEPERLDAETIRTRYPAWGSGGFVDGFYHAKGGYAESGLVVERLARWTRQEGVSTFSRFRAAGLLEESGRVVGLCDESGEEIRADTVVLATGAWTGKLLPELGGAISATGHPIFHLRPEQPGRFLADRFPTFTADVARTGYYGFPLHPREGVVKIGHHGPGVSIDPDASREVVGAYEEELRVFLSDTFPELADAELVYTRLCLYADTRDGDFWIARHPEREGLVVATGGSGHGFKFAPVLGGIIADVLEGREKAWTHKFRWRPEVQLDSGKEAARYRPKSAGDEPGDEGEGHGS